MFKKTSAKREYKNRNYKWLLSKRCYSPVTAI